MGVKFIGTGQGQSHKSGIKQQENQNLGHMRHKNWSIQEENVTLIMSVGVILNRSETGVVFTGMGFLSLYGPGLGRDWDWVFSLGWDGMKTHSCVTL